MPRLAQLLVASLAFALCVPAQALAGQRPDLVALVPDEFALCLALRDLRGEHERWQKSEWLQGVRTSAFGRTLEEAPEWRHLRRAEQELQKAFDIDWPTLRDEILGDEVVLAYRQAAPGKGEEEGVILLWARQPELLARLIERLNELQRKSGELRALETRTYKGKTYVRRNDRGKDLYYFLDGALLAAAGREETLRAILERRVQPAPSAWTQRFRRAGADRALLSLCVNPRVLNLNPGRPGEEPAGMPAFWHALEAIFVTVRTGDALEVRLSVQANVEALPSSLRPAFQDTPVPSALWQRFPEQAVATFAARTNFAEALATVIEITPPSKRVPLIEMAQRSLGAVTGLDFVKDILANVGPDWGVCLLPPQDPRHLPQVLVALAVQAGSKPVAVDQALFKAVNLFAGLAVLDYNNNHPDALRLQTTVQDKIEVRSLQGEKHFPAGFQPACALKDGYLLFASSPEAILQFGNAGTAPAAGESPLVRILPRGLATLLRQRRGPIVTKLTHKQHLAPADAEQKLTDFIDFLERFERLLISRHAAAGQADWVLRIYPAK